MPEEIKDSPAQRDTVTTTTTTSTTTSGGTTLTTDDEDDTTESKDAPFQGKRSSGGYVPT